MNEVAHPSAISISTSTKTASVARIVPIAVIHASLRAFGVAGVVMRYIALLSIRIWRTAKRHPEVLPTEEKQVRYLAGIGVYQALIVLLDMDLGADRTQRGALWTSIYGTIRLTENRR